MRIKHFVGGTASLAVIAAVTCGGSAYAQPAATPDATATAPAPDEEPPSDVGALIVTAQKREQRLQDVPIVVTIAGEQLLEDAGVNDIRQLTILTPGMTVTSTSNETIVTARIRGIGTVGDNPGLESSVGVVIDGVYRPRNGVSFGDLGDVQRIEVLKGPQGTLFGKNTSAGVISILTKAPTFKLHADAEATFGNFNQRGGSIDIGGPLIADQLAGSIVVAGRQRDGYLRVVTGAGPRTLNKDVDQDFWTTRGQLLYAPNETFTARFIADYTDRNENCCLGTQLSVGTAAGSRPVLINTLHPGTIDLTSTPFDRVAYANRNTTQNVIDKGVSLELNYNLSDKVKITSITAGRTWKGVTGQDSDFTASDIVYRPDDGTNANTFDQFSQELRLAGDAGRLNWLVGAFYAKEDLLSRQALLYGSDFYNYFANGVLGGAPSLIGLTPAAVFQPGAGARDTHKQDDKTYALFTNNDYKITDNLTATLGLRYTSDNKKLNSVYSSTGSACDQAEAAFGALAGVVGAATAQTITGGLCLNGQNNDFDDLGVNQQKQTAHEYSGTAKLAYRFSPDVMAYASYSRGYKAGGFNLDREQHICTAASPVTDAICAAKPLPRPPLNFTADPDTSFGGEFVNSYELGVKTQLLDNKLLVNATAFYQDYKDFQLNTFAGTAFIVEVLPGVTSKGVDADFVYYTPVKGFSMQGGATYAETRVDRFTAAQLRNPSAFPSLALLPGSQLSFAPKWSVSLAGTYERPLTSALELRTNISAKYVSDYNTGSDLNPVKDQPGFTLVNARIGLGAPNKRWVVELWGNNLTNEDYLQVGFDGPFQVTSPQNVSTSTYDAFLGAPRTYGVTLRSKF